MVTDNSAAPVLAKDVLVDSMSELNGARDFADSQIPLLGAMTGCRRPAARRGVDDWRVDCVCSWPHEREPGFIQGRQEAASVGTPCHITFVMLILMMTRHEHGR